MSEPPKTRPSLRRPGAPGVVLLPAGEEGGPVAEEEECHDGRELRGGGDALELILRQEPRPVVHVP